MRENHMPNEPTTNNEVRVARRTLIAGCGLLAGTCIVAGSPAEAEQPQGAKIQPPGSPFNSSIASPPQAGFTYRFAHMYDFFPFNPAAQKTFNGAGGVYTAGTATTLRASFDIPSGALVRDVEYYIYNNSGSNVYPDTYIYVPGQAYISSIGASVAIPSTGTITATRVVIPTSGQGPYPEGAKLLVGVSTPTNATVLVNGARVGFNLGGGQLALRSSPVRVFDTTQAGPKIGAGQTRQIAIPDTAIPLGAIGVLINVTASGASAPGALKVFPANIAAPTGNSVYYTTTPQVENMIVAIGPLRLLKVYASTAVNVAIDLIGTVG